MAAASRKPSLIEILLPFSVQGSRFSHTAFWVCVPGSLTSQAWLASHKSLAVSTLGDRALMAAPAPLVSRETGSQHRSRQMVSPWLLPEEDHLAAGLLSHGCESSGNGGERGGGGQSNRAGVGQRRRGCAAPQPDSGIFSP